MEPREGRKGGATNWRPTWGCEKKLVLDFSMMEEESLDARVRDAFYTVGNEELSEVGLFLGLLENDLEGTRRVIITRLMQKLDQDITTLDNDEEAILNLLEQVHSKLENLTETESDPGSAQREGADEQRIQPEERREGVTQLENEIARLGLNMEKKIYVRGELKIKGQIAGREGHGLSWEALQRQVEGLKRDHSEMRICDVVVQAVAPGTRLRSFFDCKPEMTLPSVMKVIRVFFG